MGIPELGGKHALLATGNSSAEMAIQWYFENMDNPILNEPIQVPSAKGKFDENDPAFIEAVMNLSMFGFPESACKIALKKCDMNSERAADYIMNHSPEEMEEEGKEGPSDAFKWSSPNNKG